MHSLLFSCPAIGILLAAAAERATFLASVVLSSFRSPRSAVRKPTPVGEAEREKKEKTGAKKKRERDERACAETKTVGISRVMFSIECVINVRVMKGLVHF